MLSGRGLGHTGGTLDKLEAIPGMNVFLAPEQIRDVLAETGMVICGQTDNIVPADKKIYALRDATATVGCIPLIASSIMSKKLALGTDGIVLDVKTGSGAFMKDEADSLRLCRTMVAIGEKTGRPTLGIISNMDQPLGRAVGNSLEIIESIEALKGRGPEDIMQVTYALGFCMLRAAGEKRDLRRGRPWSSERSSPRAEPWMYSGVSSPPRAAIRGSATIIPCCPPLCTRPNSRLRFPALSLPSMRSASAWRPSMPAPAAAKRKTRSATEAGSSSTPKSATGSKKAKKS